MKKLCNKCKQEKDESEFYKQSDRKNGAWQCKKCFNEYCTKRWINRKIEAVRYKGSKCVDCNLSINDSHYSVFEFHHLDPKQKDVSWTKLRLRSWEKIKKELDKCVLLCANCHRIRHHHMSLVN